jgi:dihydroxy-acid dehydratase
MPQVFGAPTASDGIMMGHQGMRYSLVSREVIADSIECVAGGMNHDGVIAFGGCDKNMPGCMIAMARINVPGIFVYAGTIKPGRWKGQDLTIVSYDVKGALATNWIVMAIMTFALKCANARAPLSGGVLPALTTSSGIAHLA